MNSFLRRFIGLILLWGLAVAGFALSGLPHLFPPGVVPLIAAASTAGLVAFSIRSPELHAALAAVSVRRLVALHIFRFVGGYFLWLQAQGRMPEEFAMRAGWGDVATAAGALILVAWPEGPGFRRALLTWNVFGAMDLFVAVGTATWLTFTRPGAMNAIVEFPLLLVPLWAVPIMLATHALIFRRFSRREAPTDSAATASA
jgi:hypothetical protein